MSNNKYIVYFKIGKEYFGVEATEVAEVIALKDANKLIGCKPFILGVISVRGILVAVLDLLNLIRRKSIKPDYYYLVVLHKRNDEGYFGIATSEMNHLVNQGEGIISEVPSKTSKLMKEFVSKVFQYKKLNIKLINTQKLYELRGDENETF